MPKRMRRQRESSSRKQRLPPQQKRQILRRWLPRGRDCNKTGGCFMCQHRLSLVLHEGRVWFPGGLFVDGAGLLLGTAWMQNPQTTSQHFVTYCCQCGDQAMPKKSPTACFTDKIPNHPDITVQFTANRRQPLATLQSRHGCILVHPTKSQAHAYLRPKFSHCHYSQIVSQKRTQHLCIDTRQLGGELAQNA